MKHFPIIITLFILTLALTACAPAATPEEPEIVLGENAGVDEIEVLMLESFPVQVTAVLQGSLPDGCTEVERVEQKLRGNTFTLKVITRRPKDAVCTLALTRLETRVPLEVSGLPAGEYTIRAGKEVASFTLAIDNVLQSE